MPINPTSFRNNVAQVLTPGLRRLVAPNPSPMTFQGTNTYILGSEKVVVIDPGPDNTEHLNAILAAIGSGELQFIFVTHSHLDHSPLASKLNLETNAPVLAFGDSLAGQSQVMRDLSKQGLTGGGEGVDTDFHPDHIVRDREFFATNEWQLEVIHTPGHMGNHISLRWGDSIFCGDLVMGWASSLVSPPDGDLHDFYASCEKLKNRKPKVLYPGHGEPITDASDRIDWLVAHRQERTAEILALLAEAALTINEITAKIYDDTPIELHPAAARNIFAHLVDLETRAIVRAAPKLALNATFSLR